MVSILPMVDLLGNTAVDWFCILSYFRLDTLPNAAKVKGQSSYVRTYAFDFVRARRGAGRVCTIDLELARHTHRTTEHFGLLTITTCLYLQRYRYWTMTTIYAQNGLSCTILCIIMILHLDMHATEREKRARFE